MFRENTSHLQGRLFGIESQLSQESSAIKATAVHFHLAYNLYALSMAAVINFGTIWPHMSAEGDPFAVLRQRTRTNLAQANFAVEETQRTTSFFPKKRKSAQKAQNFPKKSPKTPHSDTTL